MPAEGAPGTGCQFWRVIRISTPSVNPTPRSRFTQPATVNRKPYLP